MFREGYEIFVRNLDQLEENKEAEMEIRDCRTYRTKIVKGIVSRSPEKLPDGEPLWILALVGHFLDKKPWRIKINKVIEER